MSQSFLDQARKNAFVELDESEVADAIASAERFVEACAALVEGRSP